MKQLVLTILAACTYSLTYGQSKGNAAENLSKQPIFSIEETQGAHEKSWSKKLFKEHYKKDVYNRFDGDIQILSTNEIRFDNKTLRVYCDDELLPIFTLGIFYPQLIIGFGENEPISTENRHSIHHETRFLHQLQRNDYLNVSELEELTYLNRSPKVRRFRFLNFREGFINPNVYFLELSNENATKNTTLHEFISTCKLTFLKKGWVMM